LFGTDGFVRLVDESSSPTATAIDSGAAVRDWSLIPCCAAQCRASEKKKGMMVKLVPILHSSAVDLGRHAARVNQRPGIKSQPVAPFTDFDRGFT
jgi:hypothetical protein